MIVSLRCMTGNTIHRFALGKDGGVRMLDHLLRAEFAQQALQPSYRFPKCVRYMLALQDAGKDFRYRQHTIVPSDLKGYPLPLQVRYKQAVALGERHRASAAFRRQDPGNALRRELEGRVAVRASVKARAVRFAYLAKGGHFNDDTVGSALLGDSTNLSSLLSSLTPRQVLRARLSPDRRHLIVATAHGLAMVGRIRPLTAGRMRDNPNGHASLHLCALLPDGNVGLPLDFSEKSLVESPYVLPVSVPRRGTQGG